MKNKFIYPSNQLVALLHPKVLKVFIYLIGWQNAEVCKIYPKQLSKIMKLKEKEVEISIQTLIDNKLIQIENKDELVLNREEIAKYFNFKIADVQEMEQLPVSTDVIWNKTSNNSSIEDMTEEQLKALILRLQVSLNEKEQVKKIVKTPTVDLPF